MKIIRFLKTDVKIINSYFLIAVILIILISVGYFSYALFSFTKTSNNVIEGTVGELKKSGADTLIKLTNNQNDSGLYTITHSADSTLQIGATESITEYRYRGASPKNYVTFNNEVWRILGVFPTDDGTGKIENRVKIIRNESIGVSPWDDGTTAYNYTKNDNLMLLQDNNKLKVEYLEKKDKYDVMLTAPSGFGESNNWARPATLNTELNTTYLNSLTNEAQNMIGNTKYYLGGYDGLVSGQGYTQTSVQMYSYERKIQNTTSNEFYYETNPNSWVGKLALMYVSDYGYASENCETKALKDYNNSNNDLRICNNTNWLFKSNAEWLLPQDPSRSFIAFYVSSDGFVSSGAVREDPHGTRPTLYLNSYIQITGGDGTSSNPYTFGL